MHNVYELRQRLLHVWHGIDQTIIDKCTLVLEQTKCVRANFSRNEKNVLWMALRFCLIILLKAIYQLKVDLIIYMCIVYPRLFMQYLVKNYDLYHGPLLHLASPHFFMRLTNDRVNLVRCYTKQLSLYYLR